MEEIKAAKQHFLMSGCIFVHEEPHFVTTVLGSCVSVCLWDLVRKVAGMNHYMLPFWDGEGLASPKYGSIAIPIMIEKMLMLGAEKKNIQAKIFGGGEVLQVSNAVLNVGERNVLLAYDLLEREKIPVVSADVRGKTGRKIIYKTDTGSVYLKRLNQQIDDIHF